MPSEAKLNTPPAPQNATFHTVREVLEEAARIIDTSVAGLLQMAQRDDLSERDLLMSRTLAAERAKTGRLVSLTADSAQGNEGQTWLQYAPVFSLSSGLAERIANAESAQEAYTVLCEFDETFSRSVRALVETHAVPLVLLEQVSSLIDQMRRACQATYLGSNDI